LAALLTTLTSGLLLLLTGLLLATLLAALLTTLLLPALLHITHFVVRHRARLRGRAPPDQSESVQATAARSGRLDMNTFCSMSRSIGFCKIGMSPNRGSTQSTS
jgi:hypothetical protein